MKKKGGHGWQAAAAQHGGGNEGLTRTSAHIRIRMPCVDIRVGAGGVGAGARAEAVDRAWAEFRLCTRTP